MNNLARKIELASNLAIILVSLLLGMVLVKNYLLNKSTSIQNAAANPVAANGQNLVGTKISLPDVDWAKNGQTLVLALSSTCHFCSESAPFYQQLAKAHDGTRLIAALPQTISEGERYLHALGVSVDGVKQASLDSINVRGTPTLMLVNSDGRVIDSWVGKLPVDQEAEVLSKVQSNRVSN
ncbi:MAG: hypothetical protein AUG51_18750 [Acidobacteria bacterium 13_1_20CM_3_53_8]|nr:MAG: hypothetical protein AUG51_18750 [Acidobacteria bacterium 13_1_20CM_3_53_8]